MKKLVIILLLLFPLILGWNWDTHENLADKIYYSFPIELQQKLNLTLLEEGSIAPDKDFHDNVFHHYPESYPLALEWLEKTKDSFSSKDYNKASYSFGVATHYISDSFSDPHKVSKEPYYLHKKYEDSVGNYISNVKCKNYNLNLKEALEEISKDIKWYSWVKTKDKEIAENSIDNSMRLLYSVALETFNTECVKPTKIIYKNYMPSFNFIVFSFLIIIIILLIIFKF